MKKSRESAGIREAAEEMMKTDRSGSSKKRIVYLDLIRVLSAFLVVMVHVSAQRIEKVPVDGWDYAVMNAFNCLAFSGVALFVMISGALALNSDRETGIKNVLLNKTLRFFALYYIWKAMYQAVTMLETGKAFTLTNIKNDILLALIQQRGYYHLWFLPMIAIVYMSVPIIQKGVADKKVCQYFLCVFFVVEILFPTLLQYEFKFKYLFVDFFAANAFPLFSGYLGYFILGHYLHTWQGSFSANKRRLLYAAGGCGWMLACVLGTLAARSTGAPSYIMNTPFAATAFFTAAAIFVAAQSLLGKLEQSSGKRVKDVCVDGTQESLCDKSKCGESVLGESLCDKSKCGESVLGESLCDKSKCGESMLEESMCDKSKCGESVLGESMCDKSKCEESMREEGMGRKGKHGGYRYQENIRCERTGNALHFCADRVLGIYLLHPITINLFSAAGFDTSLCGPLLSIPLVTICAALVSGLAAWLLSRIPVVRRLVG